MRNRQRARSAANLFMKQQYKNSNFEAYGCTPSNEKNDFWLSYDVLMMESSEHRLIKICIPKKSGSIVFGIEDKQLCAEKVFNNIKINFFLK